MAGAISIIQVNVGHRKLLGRVRDENVYSGISKRPVRPGTALWLSVHNLSGGRLGRPPVDGGPDKAVYAYSSEHLPLWEEELGHPLGRAPFG
jgi:MOSC domain-containing protein YiiM